MRGADRVQQLAAGVDRVRERHEMLIELPRRDRIEQLALRIRRSRIIGLWPERRDGAIVGSPHTRILAGRPDVLTVRIKRDTAQVDRLPILKKSSDVGGRAGCSSRRYLRGRAQPRARSSRGGASFRLEVCVTTVGGG